MTESVLFQSIIMNLQRFWADQGCIIWQPYYTQVGAGTYNPATFLRVLGPEPWNVGYVEPSIRPDDARYGENPNRLQQHYQFQVILKPDPGNPQEIYLESLEALGVDPGKHDIRFVEDNWESPALGAWGLGWEVWLDGQEITQFTYFQQAGGINLDPPSVEITYGLERIAMALQRVRNFREIGWNNDRTYGDINLQGEQEHSKYYFEIADIERLRQMYNLFEAEALGALENGLVLPAHDYILKCSHSFNILDTRGAIGVTERQQFFRRMRDLSRKSAEAYLQQREGLGFPWIKESQYREDKPTASASSSGNLTEKSKETFLLEIGTEELPAGELDSALEQISKSVPEYLRDLRLQFETIKIMGTPRRLIVLVQGLASRQEDLSVVVKGPPAERAYDSNGSPTRAAEGFAQSKGVRVEDLDIHEIDGGKYVAASVFQKGLPALKALSEALPKWIGAIHFEKSMRWNTSKVLFSRPIRWILSMYGDEIVPFEYAGLSSGSTTRGLRFQEPQEFGVNNPDHYLEMLSGQGILVDPKQRKDVIREQVLGLMAEVNGIQELDEDLLDEVTHLVESPAALRGTFKQDFLDLPKEVLISVMKKHQRYFPIKTKSGELLPYFVAVRNGDKEYLETVIDGNEQVITARFTDASYFIQDDLKHNLEEYLPRLSTLTFQYKLGSMLDKTQRVQELAGKIYPRISHDAELPVIDRTALLCKADLVTHMVVEMTSLQGIMGQYYAKRSGESTAVADGIYEHYLPRFSGDEVPRTIPGLVVGLADRVDSIAGLFAAGLAPSSNKDPFGMRRAALGLVQNLIAWDLDFDLQQVLMDAIDLLPIEVPSQTLDACLEFISGRLRTMQIDSGYRFDVVDAILAAQKQNPAGANRAIKQLSQWVEKPNWMEILPAYSRCVRITRDLKEKFPLDENILVEPAEKELYQALILAENNRGVQGSVDDFFNRFLRMIPLVNQFFDEVLVMAEDRLLRQNRLALLQRISRLADGIADLSCLEGF